MGESAQPSKWVALASGVLIILGISLRLINLGGLEFYHDEAAALATMTGHFPGELAVAQLESGAIPAALVLRYQQLDPAHGLVNSLVKLVLTDPLHPPLYYLLCRLWIEVFGDSPAVVRAFSALIGIGCLVAVWFLALSLFGSKQTALLAVVLSAVSPFQFLLFATAREYALWVLLCVLSTRQLLEKKWSSYLLLSLLSLYTSLLSFFVLVAHALYYRRERKRDPQGPEIRIVRLALLGVVLLFIWAVLVDRYWSGMEKMNWMSEPVPHSKYVFSLTASLWKIFFDHNLVPDARLGKVLACLANAVVLSLEAAAFYSLVRRTAERRCAILLMLLIGLTLVPTVGLDLVVGGRRGMSARYHVFGYFAVLMVVVQFLSLLLSDSRRRRLGAALVSVLIGLGLLSEICMARAPTWWNKTFVGDVRDMAAKIQDPAHALILSADLFHLITISRYVEPQTQLLSAPYWPNVSRKNIYTHVYFLRGAEAELADFARQNHAAFHPLTPGLVEVEFQP